MTEKAAAAKEVRRCPKCRSEVAVRRLVVDDERGAETVFFIDCPRGDFRVAVTTQEVAKIVADMIMERLGSPTSAKRLQRVER